MATHRIWCRSSEPARRERTTSEAIDSTALAASRRRPKNAREARASFASGLSGWLGSNRKPTHVRTIAPVESRETHRHLGDGSFPSGSRSGRWVAMSPNGGTHPQLVAHVSHQSSGVGGVTPMLHIAPIASISHPHALWGCLRATTNPTTENEAAGGSRANCPATTCKERVPSARPSSSRAEPTATTAAANPKIDQASQRRPERACRPSSLDNRHLPSGGPHTRHLQPPRRAGRHHGSGGCQHPHASDTDVTHVRPDPTSAPHVERPSDRGSMTEVDASPSSYGGIERAPVSSSSIGRGP